MATCRLCGLADAKANSVSNATVFHCRRCGQWVQTQSRIEEFYQPFEDALGGWDDRSRHRRSRASYMVRRMQRLTGRSVLVSPKELHEWALDDPLPTPAEQADSLIVWIGDNQPSPADPASTDEDALEAWLGGYINEKGSGRSLSWLVASPEVKCFFDTPLSVEGNIELRLNMRGWERYGALKRTRTESRLAFMAMKFGVPDLDAVVQGCFAPAVADTGFSLRTLPDQQPAGCIDDQLRAALHACRFVIADLTYGSAGAYWEAGFAEGLGRPVIYSCRKQEWAAEKPHFDTNHLVTIVWDPDELPGAASKLKATIRATLPAEAVLIDPPSSTPKA